MTDLVIGWPLPTFPDRHEFHGVSSLITGPTIEPIDLDETKRAMKFLSTTEDTLIDTWISAARHKFETKTGIQIMTATWEFWPDGFPVGGTIELPKWPLQTVVSTVYGDVGSPEHVVDSGTYRVVNPQGPTAGRGYLSIVSGSSWPSVTNEAKAVRIRYTAGFGDAPGAVPEYIKSILYFLVGNQFRFRSASQEFELAKVLMREDEMLRSFVYADTPILGPMRSA